MNTTNPLGNSLLRYLLAALIVAGLQTSIFGYMIASRAAILRSGTEVLLKTAPVDPRDLLRGDYVVLSYDISTVPSASIRGPRPAVSGRTVMWVRLGKQPDGYWSVLESSFSELPAQDETVVLKSLPFHYYSVVDGDADPTLSYGIERYYVPDGEGRALEAARGTETLSIAVKVSSAGTAQIRSLLLDGKPVYDEPLY